MNKTVLATCWHTLKSGGTQRGLQAVVVFVIVQQLSFDSERSWASEGSRFRLRLFI